MSNSNDDAGEAAGAVLGNFALECAEHLRKIGAGYIAAIKAGDNTKATFCDIEAKAAEALPESFIPRTMTASELLDTLGVNNPRAVNGAAEVDLAITVVNSGGVKIIRKQIAFDESARILAAEVKSLREKNTRQADCIACTDNALAAAKSEIADLRDEAEERSEFEPQPRRPA